MQDAVNLLPFVGIALLFWLLIIRPASRRQKELRRMQEALKPGDDVILTSGIYGTIRQEEPDRLRVEVADGVTIRVARGAIGSVARKEELAPDEPEES